MKEFGSIDSLPYVIFSPVALLACLMTVVSGLVIMPAIGPRITSKYGQLKDKRSFDTILGSNIHHVTVSTLSFYAIVSGVLSNRIISDSTLGFALMQISLGYFVGDTILMFCNPKMRCNAFFLLHHFIGIIGYTIGLVAQGNLMFFPVSYQPAEFSGVFMNLHRAMNMAGARKDSTAYKTVGHLMVTSYFLTRIVIIPWQWIEFILVLLDPASQVVPVFFKVYTFVHFIMMHSLFLYWFPVVVRVTYYKKI